MEKPNVNYTHPELEALLPKYSEIADTLAGEDAVKKKGKIYLPVFEGDEEGDKSPRFQRYVERAVFYPVTRRTHSALIGEVFRVDPVMSEETPQILLDISEDFDGLGNKISQLAKTTLEKVLGFSRAGILVDFPHTKERQARASQAEVKSGKVVPTARLYRAEDIINWRTTRVGAKWKLALVVLKESEVISDDGFEQKTREIWRVLRLTGGAYIQEIWVEVEGKSGEYKMESSLPVFRGDGQFWDEIPFSFIGSTNNDPKPDDPVLYDLAALNLAHYRNSADYEESVFLVGQPTPWAAGLTQEWINDNFPDGIEIGSRNLIPLPEGGSLGLLQADENSLVSEAMEKKERQMKALGAKLVEQKEVQRTLGEAEMDEAAENSILATSARNVSEAITKALKWCSEFLYPSLVPNVDDLSYKLNTKFSTTTLSPQAVLAIMQQHQAGDISFTEMRRRLREGGYNLDDDETAKDEIETTDPIEGGSGQEEVE